MKNMGHNLLQIGIGLIVLTIGGELLWSFLLQAKVYLVIGAFLLGSIWLIRRIRQFRGGAGNLFMRGR